MAMQAVHFHSGDDRFCGSQQQMRQFSFDENEVTCRDCKNNDMLWLTPQGEETLRQLGYAVSK